MPYDKHARQTSIGDYMCGTCFLDEQDTIKKLLDMNKRGKYR